MRKILLTSQICFASAFIMMTLLHPSTESFKISKLIGHSLAISCKIHFVLTLTVYWKWLTLHFTTNMWQCLISFDHQLRRCLNWLIIHAMLKNSPLKIGSQLLPSDALILAGYRSGTVNSNTVNSKFHFIRSFFEIFATFLLFHV